MIENETQDLQPVVVEPVGEAVLFVEPVIEPAVEPVEEPGPYIKTADGWELVVDIGGGAGVQRFKGKTQKEATQALLEGQVNASRKIRQQENLLRVTGGGPLTPDQEEPIPEFKPRELSAEEQVDAPRYQNYLESQLGAPLETVRTTLRIAQEIKRGMLARAAGEQFTSNHPEFVPSLKNAQTIIGWLEKKGYPATLKNMEIAYDELTKTDGLLEIYDSETSVVPAVVETANAAPIPAVASVSAAVPALPWRKRPGSSTGLSRENASAPAGSAPRAANEFNVTVTVRERDMRDPKKYVERKVLMPLTSDVMKHMSSTDFDWNLLNTVGFRKYVDELQPKEITPPPIRRYGE